ncbi:hypothetical protein ACFFRR_010564 [Megaselia abdita]
MSNQVIQMTTEQLQQLIEAIKGSTVAAAPAQSKGTFGNCQARFGGNRDHNIVEEFITNVITYKEVEKISDEDALRGLPLLFYSLATTWWQGVRKEATSFDHAMEMIRSHFSPTKPSYQIYQDIFQDKQGDGTAIDTFICEKRALLAQLPDNRHDEETQLDFIYGLLNIKYRKKIPRDEVTSFKDLLNKGRLLELTIDESTGGDESHKKNPKRCTHCGYRGHTFDNCRKRKQED